MLTLIPNKLLIVVSWLTGWQAEPKKKEFTAPTPEYIRRYTVAALQKQETCEQAINKIGKCISSSYTVEQLNVVFPMLVTFASKHSHTVQGKAAEDSLRLQLHNKFLQMVDQM